MNESTFKKYMGFARSLGGDYAAGYIAGLRRHYHGDRFQLPISPERMSDSEIYGARADGFRDGLAGQPPLVDAEKMASIYMDLPASKKASYVKAAQRAEMKLIPWMQMILDNAARHD